MVNCQFLECKLSTRELYQRNVHNWFIFTFQYKHCISIRMPSQPFDLSTEALIALESVPLPPSSVLLIDCLICWFSRPNTDSYIQEMLCALHLLIDLCGWIANIIIRNFPENHIVFNEYKWRHIFHINHKWACDLITERLERTIK